MKDFKDFGIKPVVPEFTGNKVDIDAIINIEIIVHDFAVCPSKFKGDYLKMQITLNGEKRVVFKATYSLTQMIQQVPKSEFPFKTKILKQDKQYQFS